MARKTMTRAPKGAKQELLYGEVVRAMPKLRGMPVTIRERADGSLWYTDEMGEVREYDLDALEVGRYIYEHMPEQLLYLLLYRKFVSGRLGVTMLKRTVEDGYYMYEGIPKPDEPASPQPTITPAKAQPQCVICANGDCEGTCFLGHDWGVLGCDGYEKIQ